MNELRKIIFALFFAMATIAVARTEAAPVSTPLAAQGRALLPVVVSATASEETKRNAATLAEYLGRISGAKFEVRAGDGQSGIALGTASDFAGLPFQNAFDLADPTRREDYILRSHSKGVYLIGATELAVQHAVWDLLHRIGYRQFFPAHEWEVVPSTVNLSIAVDDKEHPDYLARRIWYGFGSWKENTLDKDAWDARNRMASGLEINSGHAYERIIKAHKAEFARHPEYLTFPGSTKFCISNPDLRKLVVEDALEYFEKHPDADSISLEPSDGGNWECKTGACGDDKIFKSVTDRVVTLANEVAEAVNKKYQNKYVGIYAYYMHSPPPTIKVDPHVAVTIATAYIQGGFTFAQLLEGWRNQGAKIIGVRDYYSYFDTYKDRPAGPGASDLPAMERNIPNRYNQGARLISAEATESWGAAGLSYYMASRLLWDTKENPDAIVEDFLEKSFGPAKEPMRRFYHIIDRSTQPLWTCDLIGRMYRRLDDARKLTTDPKIRARLDDLTLWTRYSEMLWNWQYVDKDKKAAGEALLKFSYRFHRAGMLHDYVLWRHSFKLAGGRVNLRKDGHPYPEATHFNAPRDKNPWMSNEPFTDVDIENFLREGIKNNPVAEFTARKFGHDLVPATKLNLQSPAPGGFAYTRMEQNYYAWFEDPANPLKLEVLGGQIAARGNTTLSLYPMRDEEFDAAGDEPPGAGEPPAGDDAADKDGEAPDEDTGARVLFDNSHPVATTDVPNDKAMHTVELKAPQRGLYRLRVVDRGKGAAVTWPRGFPIVVESSKSVQTLLRGRDSTMYFYVPKGTKVIGGFAASRSILVDASGKATATLPADPGMFSVPVPPGQDGKLWRIDRAAKVLLMTVPPYLARSADEMLLPREVVDAGG
jgi:hypothetical protein